MKAERRTAKVIGWRFYGILFGLLVLLVSLIWHLASIQVLPNESRGYEFLQSQGMQRTLRTETIPALRGMITDRNGEPLAVSTPVVSLWANPKELSIAESRWRELLNHIDLSEKDFLQRLERYKNKEFMYLERHMTPDAAEQVLSLDIPGVYGQREYRRFYPMGEVTSQLVGFTNIDDHGQEGIELAYDQWLTGVDGRKKVLKDLRGRTFKNVSLLEEPQSGNDIALSIDLRLQYFAYRALKEAVTAHRAKSGSVVLLDIHTGEVLAMANQPSFNPNDRSDLNVAALRNRAMTDQFEPGSTMKPLTVMAALESGRIKPSTIVDTNPGYVRVGRKTLLDPVNYGEMDVGKILQKSSQVGLTKISLQLEGEVIRDMFFRVGLGRDTGTGFPGESTGLLPNHVRWQPIVQANFSFGYGLSVTTLQLARAYSVLASHGRQVPVSLLRLEKEPLVDQVVDSGVAGNVASMLQRVVEKGGTGTRAYVEGYRAAGKTGTIHKADSGGYAEDRYVSLFAGFAPADNPRVAAVVMINEPKNGQYFGGEVAAPVFSSLMERSLRLMEIAPDPSVTQAAKTAKADKSSLSKKAEPVT